MTSLDLVHAGGGAAVAGQQPAVDHGRLASEVDERAVAGSDRVSEFDGLAEGDAGAAVVAGTIDQLGDKAAIQDQRAW